MEGCPKPQKRAVRSAAIGLCLLLPFGGARGDGPGRPGPAMPPLMAPASPHQGYTHREFGQGPRSYWLFEPTEPRPARAPVVVFHHGWMAWNPGVYGAWIEHLVRGGRIVIFPRYQADLTTDPADFLPNALAAVRDALDVLETAPRHVRPDRERFALIGHSAGGNLSVQMAAVAAEAGLPEPRAVIAMFPGEVRPVPGPSLARLPRRILVVVAAAEHDRIVGDLRARRIFAELASVPPSRKEFVLYRSDRHGSPPLLAEHFAPTALATRLDSGEGPLRGLQRTQAEVNALDVHGFWRLADLTLDAADSGRNLDDATAGGALIRDLGHWSDGRPVTPPLCGDDLNTIPRVFPTNGARLIAWPPRIATSTFLLGE